LKTFSNFELKTFEQLASLSQSSLKKVLASFLPRHYSKVIETDDYIFAEGDIPIALVAHMDTVFKLPPEEIFFDQRKNVLWSPDGLGADDRAGVYAILAIIRDGYRPHVIFTTDEEVGGKGALALSKLDCPFPGLKYIIELDRRGGNDCVFYDCDNQEFTDYVETFGFQWNFGSYSDICEFCPTWGVAGVNLSIGYRDEHSVSEILHVGHMFATIEKVKKMLDDAKNVVNPFIYIETKNWRYAYGLDWYGYGRDIQKCHCCGKYYTEDAVLPVVMQDGTTKFYCPTCVSDNVAWCKTCGSAYQKYSPEAPDEGTCPKCIELKLKKEKKNATR
jgi:hypothetical protein